MHDVPFTSSFHNVILRFCYKAPRRERKYRRRPRFQARYSSRAHHVTDKWSPGAGGQSVSQSVSRSSDGAALLADDVAVLGATERALSEYFCKCAATKKGEGGLEGILAFSVIRIIGEKSKPQHLIMRRSRARVERGGSVTIINIIVVASQSIPPPQVPNY